MAKKNELPVISLRTTRSIKDVSADHDTDLPPAKKQRIRRVTMSSPAGHTIKLKVEPTRPRSTRKSSASLTREKLMTESPSSSEPAPTTEKVPDFMDLKVWKDVNEHSAFCTVCNQRLSSGGDAKLTLLRNHLGTAKHKKNLEKVMGGAPAAPQSNIAESHPPTPRSASKASPPPTFHEPITPAATPPINDTNTPTNNPSRYKTHIINHINGMRVLWESHYQIPIGLNQLRISTTLARHTPLIHLAMGIPPNETTTLPNAFRLRFEALDGVIKRIEQGLGDLLDAEMQEIQFAQDIQGNVAQYQSRCNRLREARKGAVELGEFFKEAAYDFQLADDLLKVVDQKVAEGTIKVERFAEVLKGILSEALVELSRA